MVDRAIKVWQTMLDDGYLLLEAIFYQGNIRKIKRINPRE